MSKLDYDFPIPHPFLDAADSGVGECFYCTESPTHPWHYPRGYVLQDARDWGGLPPPPESEVWRRTHIIDATSEE